MNVYWGWVESESIITMFTLKKLPLLMLLLVVAFAAVGICLPQSDWVERKLTAKLNPGCPDSICPTNSTGLTLIYIRAESPTDTIHYLWDFTQKPTILVALTEKNVTLNISWEHFRDRKSESVSFSKQPKYVFMTVINRIFLFDDPKDTGVIANDSTAVVYDPHSFAWNRTLYWNNEKDVILAVNADNNFLFKLNAYSTRSHGMEYPHLLHTSNSTQIDIVFNNVSSKFDRPRFAIELLFVMSEQAVAGSSLIASKRKSLDDEHTPGIFEIIDVLSPGAFKYSIGGYLEYRPVSYTHSERDVSTSTETHQSETKTVESPSEELQATLAYAIFGKQLDSLLVQGMNISFGLSGDGFYSKTNYTTMTFQVGYGSPPLEQFSAFVLVVAGIGIGVPLALIVIGGLYVCVKKLRTRSETNV
ncbi:glycosylated lysosomal membrane protein-like [Topomyia yanbarensis]|uniref:glycosylated lysosomal membrane protein-like n=1 Tax=Topomyia yanbarensis TaxID=2498891 RepID=UPI00273AA5D2|nr:glycosylated lysosomal membrane protein-like [Topomyia yanbarensis]